jgi:hypothetical protein
MDAIPADLECLQRLCLEELDEIGISTGNLT